MVKRPVYIVLEKGKDFVEELSVEFKWFSGFSLSQKQKSINDLHENFQAIEKNKKVLEISSKSKDKLGVLTSAFNLFVKDNKGNNICTVESLFQSAKRFEKGGPYRDIINKTSREAKKDERLKNSGELIEFNYKGEIWGLEPKTHFYDWLYINALYQNKELAKEILNYDAFTDIEFNPKKSINNQAKAAALFVSLHRRGILPLVIKSKDYYLEIIKRDYNEQITF